MIIDSGYGSAIPSCIVAHMSKGSAASKSGLVNVGDHILSINGTSLVGMPLKLATDQIKVRDYTITVDNVYTVESLNNGHTGDLRSAILSL